MIIELTNGRSRVRLVPDCGMNSIEIVLKGKSIMRRISGEDELRAAPNVYGTPLLLPANRTAGGRFAFEGTEYQLGINEPAHNNFLHGFLSTAVYEITEKTESSVTAVYRNEGEIYPFPFSLEVMCKLEEAEYRMIFTLSNTGNRAMPVCFAVHAAFDEPENFDAAIDKAHIMNEHFIPTGELRPLSESEREFNAGTLSRGKTISAFYTMDKPLAHIGDVEFRVSDNFNQWILWNQGGDKGFLCVEPQCGAVNCLNSGDGLMVIPAGEKEVFEISFRR